MSTATPAPVAHLEAAFSAWESATAQPSADEMRALTSAVASVEKSVAKSAVVHRHARQAVATLCNTPSLESIWITTVFGGPYPMLEQMTFECTSKALKARRELIVATLVARLERCKPANALSFFAYFNNWLRSGDLMPMDFKPSFSALVAHLGAILAAPPQPPPPKPGAPPGHADWSPLVELCRTASMFMLQSPVGLGALCLAMAQPDALNNAAAQGEAATPPSLEVFRACYRLASGSVDPFAVLTASPTTALTLGEIDAWCALASYALNEVKSRAALPLAVAATALDLVAQSLAASAHVRSALTSAQRRALDLSGLVAAFSSLAGVVAVVPALSTAVENAIVIDKREYLIEFDEVSDVAATVHRRLGAAHLARLAHSICERASRLDNADLDEGDVLERSMIFDIGIVAGGDIAAHVREELRRACFRPEFCPALTRALCAWVLPSLAPEPTLEPWSVSADKVVPMFAHDPARAPAFVQAVLGGSGDVAALYYEALVEAPFGGGGAVPDAGAPPKSAELSAAAREWAALWGARALVATTLKSHLGLAPETFQHIEERLRADNSDALMLALAWHLEREMLTFPANAVAKDRSVASFFTKNRAACASWSQKLLGNAAAAAEAKLSLGTGVLPVWLFHSAESPSLVQACAALAVLVARRDGAGAEVLADWAGAAVSPVAAADFATGSVAYAQGGYLSAAPRLRRATAALLDSGQRACEPALRFCANAALECLALAGRFDEAAAFVGELAELQVKSWSKYDADDADCMGDALVPAVFSRDVLAALSSHAAREAVTLPNKAVLQTHAYAPVALLADVLMASSSSGGAAGSLAALKAAQAPLGTRAVRTGLDLLANAAAAVESKNRFVPMAPADDGDFYYSFLHVARSRAGFAADASAAVREATRAAADARDAATAICLLNRVDAAPRAVKNGLALAQLLAAAGMAAPPAWLYPSQADAELLLAAKPSAASRAQATSPDALFAWAARALATGQETAALEALECCLQLSPGHVAACIQYVACIDAQPARRFSADLPLDAVRAMLPHLLARARRDERVGEPLARLAEDRAVIWALVGEAAATAGAGGAGGAGGDGPVAAALLRAMQAHPVAVQETQMLVASLVEAARTWDEDWEAFLDDQLVAGTRDAAAAAMADLHARTLGRKHDGAAVSAYNSSFAASSAGAAVAELCENEDGARWGELVRRAKEAVGRFMHAQGSKRSFASLVPRPLAVTRGSVAIPGLGGVAMRAVDDALLVLKTKTRPRKITLMDETGVSRSFLLKSAEDLHLDQRVVGVWEAVNPRLARPMRTYHVQPLSRSVGLIQWVERSVPLYHYYRTWRSGLTGAGVTAAAATDGVDVAETELFKHALAEHGGNRLAAFRHLRGQVDGSLLAKAFWASSGSVEAWWEKSTTFAASCGVGSGFGWVLGLGDRHLDNILVDVETGTVAHIDLNVCFDKGLTLRVPETVPFRLTAVMARAFPLGAGTGNRGHFARAMADTVEVLRQAKPEIMACLDAFVFDPVVGRSDAAKRARARAELEAALTAFAQSARAWMADAAVTRMRQHAHGAAAADDDVEDAMPRESEYELRTQLERARLAAQRALTDCVRQVDFVAQALALVRGGRCQALANADAQPIELAAAMPAPVMPVPPQPARSAQALLNQAAAFAAATQKAQQKQAAIDTVRAVENALHDADRQLSALARGALGELCGLIGEAHPTLASFGLDWGVALERALKTPPPPHRAHAPPSKLGDVAELVSALEVFRGAAIDALDDAKNSEDAWKRLPSPQTPAQLQAQSRMDRALKRVKDGLALCDACATLVAAASRPSLHAEQQALEALSKAQARYDVVALAPVWQRACAQAPVPATTELKSLGSAHYERYLAAAEVLQPFGVAAACAQLEAALAELPRLAESRAAEGDREGGAKKQALLAKQRVASRLDATAKDARVLVGHLIGEAVNESNLAAMWEGWMAWV